MQNSAKLFPCYGNNKLTKTKSLSEVIHKSPEVTGLVSFSFHAII
uniref:Uncharacterized protein n=1 Tax=Arundo donax TaxID=35708 RepID=A0A0A9A191_ARUDO